MIIIIFLIDFTLRITKIVYRKPKKIVLGIYVGNWLK